MTKHYVLSINPQAQYDWDQYVLRNPITGERPDLTALVAEAVNNQPGAYLVSVNIEVQVLEQSSISELAEKAHKIAPIHQLAAS